MVPDKAISMTMMVWQALAILKVHKDMVTNKAIGMTMMAEQASAILKVNTKIWLSSTQSGDYEGQRQRLCKYYAQGSTAGNSIPITAINISPELTIAAVYN
ncbi:hypothetical protein Tco_1236471 [Tanacetum coccineum]